MDEGVRLARFLRPGRDERGQLLARLAPPPRIADGRRFLRPGRLRRLALAQKSGDLLGLQKPGNTKEIGFLVGSGLGAQPEFAAVKKRPVERRIRFQRLKAGECELVAGLLF